MSLIELSWTAKNLQCPGLKCPKSKKETKPKQAFQAPKPRGGIGLLPPTFLLLLLYWHWLFTFENGDSGDQHSWNTLNRIYFSYKWQIQLTDGSMHACGLF